MSADIQKLIANLPKDQRAQIEAELRKGQKAMETLASRQRITFKVSEKGGVSVYGLGRFPVTLYGEQWQRFLKEVPALEAFLEAHKAELSTKENGKSE